MLLVAARGCAHAHLVDGSRRDRSPAGDGSRLVCGAKGPAEALGRDGGAPGAFAMGLLIRLQRGDMIPVAGSLALGIRGSFKQWPNID
jgi:hypothetical protein